MLDARPANQHGRLHTPDILTHLICNNMDSWLSRRPVLPPALDGPEEAIQRQIRSAFKAQPG
jgi:hypothetical protein